MAIGSFIFGGNTGDTPESLARRREIQDALAAQIMGNQPTSTMGGIGSILQGLAVGYGRYKDNKLESTNREAGTKTANDLLSKFFTGNRQNPSNAMPGDQRRTSFVQPPVEGTMQNARQGDRASMADYAAQQQPTDMRQGIAETAASLGIDPVDLATAISYETAGTFDPTKKGPTTQWGRHQGLIQFGEPQAKEYGVDWNNPVGSQLGKDGAIAKYLKNAGVQPGMGMMDIYSAINAGRVGRNDASDANNGGAPGTVADKVNNQMGAHRQKALALLGMQEQDPAAAAIDQNFPQTQVASSDPAIGMQQQIQQPQADPQQQQMAQANPFQGVDPKLIEAMNNPWIPQETRAMLQTVIQEQMKQSDPAYQMQLEKGKLELDAMKNPGPEYDFISGKDGSVFRADKRSGKMETVHGSKEEIPDTVRSLQLRAKAAGLQEGTPEYMQFMASGGAAEKAPSDVQEYEYAKKQGYAGSFQQWQIENKKAGAQNTTVNLGEGDKFYENLDKKNAETFAAMSDSGVQARAKIGQIDRLQTLMTNAPQGGIGVLKQAAGNWGIATDGLSDIQAASALLEKMVPEQRMPGTGPMSDSDIKMFRASLPRILNQPGGNQLIFDTLRGVANYEMQMGEIADQVADRAITPAAGRKMIRELKNPLADLKTFEGSTPNEGWTEISPGVRVRKVE